MSTGIGPGRWIRTARICAALLAALVLTVTLPQPAHAQTTTFTTVTPSSNTIVFGQSITLSATVTPSIGPTGTVSFYYDANNFLGTVNLSGAGTASLPNVLLPPGSHLIFATYNGDSNFAASLSVPVLETVNKPDTTSTLLASTPTTVFGQPATFSATVTVNPPGSGIATGTVTFFLDATTQIGTSTLDANGNTIFTTAAIATGHHTILAVYNGSNNFNGGNSNQVTQTVNPASTTTAVSPAQNPSVAGQSVGLSATVTANSPGAGTPTGTVTFAFGDGSPNATVSLSGGTATANHTFATNATFTVTATYNADANFLASTGSLQQNVIKSSTTALVSAPNPGNIGQPVNFTATVSGTSGTPTGTVTFSFGDGSAVVTASLVAGVVPTVAHQYAVVGTFTVTATYSGDANFGPSTATLQQRVNVGASSTTLTSSLNPSQSGQPVTFTATVSGSGGTPTGTITFKDGAAILGSSPLSGGVATFITTALTVGSHSITASFGGSATLAASTSAPVIQLVNFPADSMRLRAMQVLAAPVAAQASGQAISGAVDAAITEGFSGGGGAFVTPNATGLRFNFAADPEARAANTSDGKDSLAAGNVGFASPFRGFDGSPRGDAATSRVNDGFSALAYATKAVPSTNAPPRIVAPPDWLGWAEVRGSVLGRWNNNNALVLGAVPGAPLLFGDQVNVLAGVTRRVTPTFLVGALGGYETFDYRSDALQGRLKGDGWTVGAYLGWKLTQNIRFDAAAAYSGIGYDGSAGLATGSFDGHRWLVSGGLTGVYEYYALRIEPSARVYALWEHENAYTDSLATPQAARNFSTGRASTGVKVAYPVQWSATTEVAPYLGGYADYYFNADDAGQVLVAPAVPTQFVMAGWSARAVFGLVAKSANGAQISAGGERGGIGGNFAVWIYRARASVPFSAQ